MSATPSLYLEFKARSHRMTLPLYKTPDEVLSIGLDMSQWIGDSEIQSADIAYRDGNGLVIENPVIIGAGMQAVAIGISGGKFGTRHLLTVTTTMDDGQVLNTVVPVAVMR